VGNVLKKLTGLLLALTSLFVGIILGFLLSPVKHGINIGNDSGNSHLPAKENTGEEN